MSADASAFTSSGRTSYSCGSVFGVQQRRDLGPRRDVARHVAELRRGGDDRRAVRRPPRCRRRRRRPAGATASNSKRRTMTRQHNETHSHFRPGRSRSRPRDAPIAAMLCSKPLMDGPRLTRRQAVRLGAGAAALGALRLPSPAFAATSRRCSSSPSTPAARTPPPPAGARPRCCRPRAAFDLLGLVWDAGTPQAQVRARRRGGRWTRWTPLPHNHAGDRDRTDPVFTGSADEFQLRLRGGARGLRARFVRALPHAPAPPRPRRCAPGQRAGDRPARRLGRRQRPAARRRRATATCRSRSCTTRSRRSTTRPRNRRGSSSGSRAITATPTAGTTSVTTSSSTATA